MTNVLTAVNVDNNGRLLHHLNCEIRLLFLVLHLESECFVA